MSTTPLLAGMPKPARIDLSAGLVPKPAAAPPAIDLSAGLVPRPAAVPATPTTPAPDGWLARAYGASDRYLGAIPYVGRALSAVGTVGRGMAKDIGAVVRNLGTPAPSLAAPVTVRTPGGKTMTLGGIQPSPAAKALAKTDLTPHGAAERLGYDIADVGSFFTPLDEMKLGDLGKVGEAGEAGANIAGRLAALVGRGGGAARTIGRLGGDAAKEAAKNALVASAQGENAKSAAAWGAAAPAGVEAFGQLARAVRPMSRLYEAEERPAMDALAAGEIATPREVAETAILHSIPLTAGEVMPVRSLDNKNQAAAASIYGLRGRVATHAQQALDAWRGAVNGWLERLAPEGSAAQMLRRYGPEMAPSDAGNALRASAQHAADYATNDIGMRYDALHELVGDKPVNVRPLANLGDQILGETERARAAIPNADPRTASRLAGDLANIESAVKSMRSGSLPFRDAQLLRTRLWKIGNVPSDIISDEAQQVAKRALEPLTAAMAETAKTGGAKAEGLWKSANRAWANYASTFGKRGEILNTLLSADTDSDLERLPKKVLDGSLAKLQQLRAAGVNIGPAKQVWLREALGGPTLNDLPSLADRVSGVGAGWLQHVFSDPAEFDALKALQRRGLVEGVVAPNGYQNAERAAGRLQRAATSSELHDLLGDAGARDARALTTIGNRVGRPFNASGSGDVINAVAAPPTDPATVLRTLAKGRFLGNVLDPASADRITGYPTLGTGARPYGRLAAAVRRNIRYLAGSTAGAAGAAGAEK